MISASPAPNLSTTVMIRSFSGTRCSANSLTACANRSWSAGGSTLPVVTSPGFSEEPAHDDDHVRESDPEVDHPPFPLGTPHQLFVSVLPGVRTLHHPAVRSR